MALGALIIQAKTKLSDRELVQEIAENPYCQYFIGLEAFQNGCPFTYSVLPHFRMRITQEINEYVLKAIEKQSDKDNDKKPPKGNPPQLPADDSKDSIEDSQNTVETRDASGKDTPVQGTLILDATCAPSNIRYPMDCALLNDAREKVERIVKDLCHDNGEIVPRMYLREAHRAFLDIAKCKKPSHKKISKAVKKQLQYLRRDLAYVDRLLEKGYVLSERDKKLLETIRKLYEQQKYMYENKIHTVSDCIVSISQPFLRPIVRGKANKPVEFGAKLEVSVDTFGYQHLEKISFDAYNEEKTLQDAVEHYLKRTGCDPERLLVDKIYNNRKNRAYCKEKGIRISGPALGRPKNNNKENKKIEYKDMVDRIGVERAFSRDKGNFGMGLVKTKLESTIKTVIAMSVLTANLFKALGEVFVFICSCFLRICGITDLRTKICMLNLAELGA